MDCLARNLGLDIEALARSLAMNNDGRKPIQCLDVEDDAQDMKNKNEEATNGALLKMQKVNDTQIEESKEQDLMVHQKKCDQKMKNMHEEADFVKESRQTSFKTCNSGDAIMVDEQNLLKAPLQKLTPMNPIKEISNNLQK